MVQFAMEDYGSAEWEMQREMMQRAQSDALEMEKNMMGHAMSERDRQVKYVQQQQKQALKQRGEMLKQPSGQGISNPRQAHVEMARKAAHARQQHYVQGVHQHQNRMMELQRHNMEQRYNMMHGMMNNGGGFGW